MLSTRNREITTGFELRSVAAGSDGLNISGYAAVFNSNTLIREAGGIFIERIKPGAFTKTLSERADKVAMQYAHGRDPKFGTLPIGKWTDIRQDSQGLHLSGRLFDTPEIRHIAEAIQTGAIYGQSFAFGVTDEVWRDRATGKRIQGDAVYRMISDSGRGSEPRVLREITAVNLYECGPVLSPAYEQTTVGVRSAALDIDEMRTRLWLLLETSD